MFVLSMYIPVAHVYGYCSNVYVEVLVTDGRVCVCRHACTFIYVLRTYM